MRNQYGMYSRKSTFLPQMMANWTIFAVLAVVMTLYIVSPAYAESAYQNANGYEVYFEDKADLLTDEEEIKLQTEMQCITEYGNVAFITIEENYTSTGNFADSYSYTLWGDESGTLFVIDMDNREIYISNSGKIMRTITNSRSLTITDNVYTYASAADYYTCASKTYEQVYTLLEGGRINQPMKYASNALLAFVLSIIILYFLVKAFSAAGKPSESELLEGLEMWRKVDNFKDTFAHTTRKYSPQSSGSSGGGGRSGGGSRGGGGRSGGGHRF